MSTWFPGQGPGQYPSAGDPRRHGKLRWIFAGVLTLVVAAVVGWTLGYRSSNPAPAARVRSAHSAMVKPTPTHSVSAPPAITEPPATTAPPASSGTDVDLSCSPADDYAPSGAETSELYPVVAMQVNNYVSATEVDVTIIGFSTGGDQIGSETVSFGGPFAGGQTFQSHGDDMGSMAYCYIANVSANEFNNESFTYDNESPVPGS